MTELEKEILAIFRALSPEMRLLVVELVEKGKLPAAGTEEALDLLRRGDKTAGRAPQVRDER